MHMLIRVFVPAPDPTEAVCVARFALDRLTGIGEGASTAFEYYKTLDESTAIPIRSNVPKLNSSTSSGSPVNMAKSTGTAIPC